MNLLMLSFSSLSSIVASNAQFLSCSCNYSVVQDKEEEDVSSCDLFDGCLVEDEDSEPLYKPGSCPFIDDSFNCFKIGHPDSDYLRLRWKPSGCQLLRFDSLKMLVFGLWWLKMAGIDDELHA